MRKLCVLLVTVLNCIEASAIPDVFLPTIQGSLMGRWFTYIISRGFYLILISLIFICFAITAIRKKFDSFGITASDALEALPFGGKRNENNDDYEDFEIAKKKLKETETKMKTLEVELEDTHRMVMDLEISADVAEKRKNSADDEILFTRLDLDLEIENLTRENETLLSLLHSMQMENESLNRQIEVLKREARISEAVIKDKDNLSDRLKGARIQLDDLKFQLKGIQMERDTAVRLAAEHIYKLTSEISPQRIEVIEEMIDAELKRVREEEEVEQEVKCPAIAEEDYVYAKIARSRGSEDRCSLRAVIDTQEHTGRSEILSRKGSECYQGDGDGPPGCTTCNEESTQQSDNSQSQQESCTSHQIESNDESKVYRIITRSPAFKSFLQNVFGQPS